MVLRNPQQLAAVLETLADLSPTARDRPRSTLRVDTEWFRWLGFDGLRLFVPNPPSPLLGSPSRTDLRVATVEKGLGDQLASISRLRTGDRPVQVGWLWVAGRTTDASGREREVLHPLVTLPVRVLRSVIGPATVHPAGDLEVSALVEDAAARDRFETVETGGGAFETKLSPEDAAAILPRLPKLQAYARDLAAAAGFAVTDVVLPHEDPEDEARRPDLVVLAQPAVFTVDAPSETSRAGSLRAWAERDLDRWTAFHSLYLDDDPPPTEVRGPVPADSPFVLAPAQRAVVNRARSEAVTLLSGAPGNGKSHTLAAVACDALARGERVLVAAKSDATVDALIDRLQQSPGPEPVVFGSSERRDRLAAALADGQLPPVPEREVEAAAERLSRATEAREGLRAEVVGLLEAEALAAGHGSPLSARLLAADLGPPLVEVLATIEAGRRGGWLARRRARKAGALLVAAATGPDGRAPSIDACVRAARSGMAARAAQADGDVEVGDRWERLRAADDAVHDAQGAWLQAATRGEDRVDRRALAAMAALATALRSGRAARRAQLARMDDALSRALPLWIGTLADVDDLLPAQAGLFDLVIVDEASSVDQPLAAAALLRGRRAVIAGDPRQLRQVSFLADDQAQRAIEAHGLADQATLAAKLDVRRNSLFDLAASVAPVTVLDEHFRSAPHLVDFVAERLYGGQVLVATRTPATEGVDCIEVAAVRGVRDGDGVVAAEVAEVLDRLQAAHAAGRDNVGVVSPFRAQADAIEQAVLDALTADEIEALDLRVGTVHGFQGNEREEVLVSLAVDEAAGRRGWTFVEDPHLFAVLSTRARRHLTVVHSAAPPADGLVAGYLAQGDAPPGPPASGIVGPWPASVAEDLRAAGLPVVTAYPTGRHAVDVAIDDPGRPTAVVCDLHPDGPDAHIDRHLALRRVGWEVVEALPSRWADDRAALVLDLVGRHRTDESSGPSASTS